MNKGTLTTAEHLQPKCPMCHSHFAPLLCPCVLFPEHPEGNGGPGRWGWGLGTEHLLNLPQINTLLTSSADNYNSCETRQFREKSRSLPWGIHSAWNRRCLLIPSPKPHSRLAPKYIKSATLKGKGTLHPSISGITIENSRRNWRRRAPSGRQDLRPTLTMEVPLAPSHFTEGLHRHPVLTVSFTKNLFFPPPLL